jgi:hypothetical protein
MKRAEIDRGALTGVWGVLAGASVGALLVVLVGAGGTARPSQDSPGPLLEATHRPALLTVPDEPVDLRYDVYCGVDDDAESACRASGTVFVRSGSAGELQGIPLHVDPDADEGRYAARVPEGIAQSLDGFSYYAVLRDDALDTKTTLPAGGADAPHRSFPLERAVTVRLGAHAFGHPRKPDGRVAEAAWGDGPDDAGLEQGRNLPPIGGTAFDVDTSGTVTVLDEAHRRLLRWRDGARAPSRVPLEINGTLADMSVAGDGTIYVLESTGAPGGGNALRVFGPNGAVVASGDTAERSTQVRIGPNGPVVLQQPSGQWMHAAVDGTVLPASSQRESGRSGRPVRGGDEVVVLRVGNEVRAAIVGPNGLRRSWRVTSETPLAEVQLAEPVGNQLVLVVRVYTDDLSEFLGLVVGPKGIVRTFSLASADWAETAPLSRFRLVGSSLYQLGSTQAGLFVDRFRLEVK